jgi:hypothetical protein
MGILQQLRQIVFLAFLLSGFCVHALGQTSPSPSSEPATGKYVILSGGKSGSAISAQTTHEDLIRAYGKKNVVATDVGIGEGETEPGTELFPTDRLRRVQILWKDPINRRGLKRVEIEGAKSLWRTSFGISLGTTLKQLEQLNGEPFQLTGFAWDYSGTVMSWSGGKLSQELSEVDHPGRVLLRLDCSPTDYQKSTYRLVVGDRTFSSAHPSMQSLNPTVYDLIWLFP